MNEQSNEPSTGLVENSPQPLYVTLILERRKGVRNHFLTKKRCQEPFLSLLQSVKAASLLKKKRCQEPLPDMMAKI
jgi:hypothetical protein